MQNNCDVTSAGFGVRFFAYLIDLIIKGIIILIIRFNFMISGFSSGDSVLAQPVLFRFNSLDIAAYLAGVAYFIMFTYFSGASVGKHFLKLRVISTEGGKLPFFDVAYRETIGRYLSGILFIGYIFAAFHPQRQGFHDILSNTRVIYSFKTKTHAIPAAQGIYAPHAIPATHATHGFAAPNYPPPPYQPNAAANTTANIPQPPHYPQYPPNTITNTPPANIPPPPPPPSRADISGMPDTPNMPESPHIPDNPYSNPD